MAPKRKGLGRGLDALIPNKINNTSAGSDEKSLKKPQTKKTDEVSADTMTEKTEKVQIPEQSAEMVLSEPNPAETDTMTEKTEKEHIPEQSAEMVISEPNPAETVQIDKKTETKIEENTDNNSEKVLSVKISLVEPNRDQPRKKFNEEGIDELAASISQYGVIQPLLVQWKDNYYEIIAGERRWRAAMKAGLKEIPVIVKEYSNKEAVEISLIENIQREDLNPIEEALAYERLVEEFEMTQEQVAERVSKSRSAVTNSMRLLKLEGDVREMVVSGDLSEGHARTLLSLPTAEAQKLIADRIVKEKLSVRDTEKLVKKLVSDVKRPAKKRDYEKEAILGNLSEQLKDIFGTKVSISCSR